MTDKKTKIIVLCAGEGKRLRPLSEGLPKCMVPFLGKPLLSYQLDLFESLGLVDIVLIGGYCADKLPQNYTIVLNPEYASTNMLYSLLCTTNHMSIEQDLVIAYGDIVYSKAILEALLVADERLNLVIDLEWLKYWHLRMPDPLLDAETFKWIPNTRRILEIGKKPQNLAEIQGQYIGLFKVKKDFVYPFKSLAQQFLDARGKKVYMTDFLQWLIEQNTELYGVPIRGQWAEFDTFKDLQVAENIFELGT